MDSPIPPAPRRKKLLLGFICFLFNYVGSHLLKSARTVGAKGRVFPEALTQSALAGGGGGTFLAGKMHGTFIKQRNLQHFEAPDSLR